MSRLVSLLHKLIQGSSVDDKCLPPGCDSLTWPRVDGLKWLHLCGRGCAVVTV
jgi:hypothetical protein